MNDDESNSPDNENDPQAAIFRALPDGLITPAVYRPSADDGASPLNTEETGMRHVLNYYFPVYIEAAGTLRDEHMEQIADYIFDALDTALRAQA